MAMIGDHEETIVVQPKEEPLPSNTPMPAIAPAAPAPASTPVEAPELVPA